MAVHFGNVPTRIMVGIGDAEPSEVARIDFELTASTRDGKTVVQGNSRRFRRRLALAFLRVAWMAWTARDDDAEDDR
ncbi:hypothetical protein [Microbacterium sp. IEGM 1404]|uniref:hypothetical protein n=1 Tax=Microbacterium sp. IEGM 1404 TaxID=3047084 RepID=UPI0024B6D6D4|nr:hypothetical protein [Microbacterium sp. IEGM 1404]MDI9889961.1 hypothetical protein [Microbacterium sp. IEGM 1404]